MVHCSLQLYFYFIGYNLQIVSKIKCYREGSISILRKTMPSLLVERDDNKPGGIHENLKMKMTCIACP